jgi:arylsulfatase A-like enzyme/Flp pilus assembly protein TadD
MEATAASGTARGSAGRARRLALAFAAVAVATGGACRRAPQGAGRDRARPAPNVLLVTLDTVRADHVSCDGRSPVPTPHLDGLARRGARFTRAFAQVPLTTPSHACLLTGTDPSVHGIRDNGGFALAPGVPTLASLAREAGYETAAFVAAAVLDREFGLDRGFDRYADGRGSGDDPAAPGAVPELPGRVVTDRALAWLAARRTRGRGASPGKPFLAWVHYFDAHAPYDPPSPFRERHPADPYSGEVAAVDHEVGRLLEALDEEGLAGSTLVVAVSDHGEALGDHGEFTHGVFLYDATTRIALLIAGPGVPGGRVVDDLVRSIDVLPTLAELAGFLPGDRNQGTSLVPALQGGRVRTGVSHAETLYPRTNLGWAELRSVRTEEWKLILAPRPELYRLFDDPAERHDVHARFPEEAERLGRRAATAGGGAEAGPAPALAPVTREQLQALGYVGAGARPESTADGDLPDPKDRLLILEALERAERLIRGRQYDAAAAALEKAAAEDPRNPAVHAHLSHCYERMGALPKAIRAQRRAVEKGAATDDTYARLGANLLRVGDLRGAATAFEKAVERNPGNLRAAVNLATAALDLDKLDQAESVAQGALERRESLAPAWNVLGVVAARRGRAAEARGHFEKALALDPSFAEPYLNLGLLYEQAGQGKEAVRCYREFLSRADRRSQGALVAQVEAAVERLTARR